jgi:diadenosine tetraphosphate (Ap4A) HIT family hydrolase
MRTQKKGMIIMDSNDCVFCKIIRKEEPSNIIYEDELVCCFLDIDPINEGHILIVPKQHHSDIDYLDNETLLRITKLSVKFVSVIKKEYNPDGYTIMQNGGIFADFGHYHLHVFPRYDDDEFGWICKGFELQNSLEAIKEKLITAFQEL